MRLHVSALCALAACSSTSRAPAPATAPATPPFVEASLDRRTSPCDSLYQFACGGWLASTPIPADHMMWDASFTRDRDRGQDLIRELLDAAARGSGDPKLGDFWAACLDERAAADSAAAWTRARFAQIDALATPADLARLVAQMQLEIYDGHDVPLFSFSPAHDYDDATQTIGELDQAGIELDPDYYTRSDPDRVRLRDAYRVFIADGLAALGEPRAQADADAQTVLAIETELATAALDRRVRRDPRQREHRVDRAGLRALVPSFDWDAFFSALGMPDVQALNVVPLDEFRALDRLVRPEQLARLKPYLKWYSVVPNAWLTGGRLFELRHVFRQAAIGVTDEPPRWRNCIDAATQIMPDAIGRAYVARAFGPDAKARALDMVERIESAFDANLSALDWMDGATRAASRDKLRAVVNQIGYPARWHDYSGVAIDRRALLPSYLAGVVAVSRHELAKIGKPVDRSEMTSPAQTVDASYNPSLNEMTFPAGIMQPPFFAPDAPAAANFGGIGFIVGHELTHGFDDQGRQFDGRGNLRDWWTAPSAAAYTAKAACVADQYSGYVAVGDIHLDGKATLGENIADNGGLLLAHAAFEAQRGGRAGPSYAGFTDEQQFFIAFAQAWCTNVRPESEAFMARTDEHSQRRWRVDGSAANLPAFAQAFGCPAGAPMAPVKRCGVW